MKCKKCNYDNPDDALSCGLCGRNLKDEPISVSPASPSGGQGQGQPRNYDVRPSISEEIKYILQDYKWLVAVGVGILVVALFFGVISFVSAQKHRDFENKIAELSYPIYAALVTGKQPDSGIIEKVNSLVNDYASNCSSREEVQAIQAAIQRGQERARKKIKQDYNVKCPYF